MTLAINAVYHGFKVLQAQFVDEISSQAYIMEHIKSGARLLYLANDDDNKVFSISFRTPPADDTGRISGRCVLSFLLPKQIHPASGGLAL